MTENEVRATAVREAAAYIERIYKRGLQSRDSILADLDSVAWRMEEGMTARGSMRANRETLAARATNREVGSRDG